MLGLTAHVDDDNPLWADLDGGRARPSAWGESGQSRHRRPLLASRKARRGAFGATSAACATISNGWSTKARRSMASSLPLVFDIDRAHDVEAAEQAGFDRRPETCGA